MTHTIAVREAVIDDVHVLASIGQASFTDAYEASSEPSDLLAHLDEFYSEAAVRDAMEDPHCWYLLATREDTGAGFVKIRDSETPAGVPAQRAFELSQVYVVPDQQRFGIGGRLLEAAAGFAAQRAATGVWLSVWEDAPWAINCYRKYGFDQVGTAEFRVGETVYHDLLMWLAVKD